MASATGLFFQLQWPAPRGEPQPGICSTLHSTFLLGASRRQVATTPPSPTAAKRSPLGANRTAAALPQLASLRKTRTRAVLRAGGMDALYDG